MSDKNELLDEIQEVLNPRKKLDFEYFIHIILLIVFLLMLAFPKIYISEQIYFKSRDISKLENEYETLKEENKEIKTSVEELKFKNQVIDTIF